MGRKKVSPEESAAAKELVQRYRYGLHPQQVEGVTSDGRPFYFRERNQQWDLCTGPAEAAPDYSQWCADATLVAYGDGSPEPDGIDQLITEHLGVGWTHRDPMETGSGSGLSR